MRYPQVKNLDSIEAFRSRCAELDIEVAVDGEVDPNGALAQPVDFIDGSAGTHRIPNRFAILPMEGWDGTADGHSTDLVRRRWRPAGSWNRSRVVGWALNQGTPSES